MIPRSLAAFLCVFLLVGTLAANRQLELIQRPIAQAPFSVFATHMTSVGNLVLAAAGNSSASSSNFWVFDVTEATPKLLGGCRVPGLATQPSTDGRYAYVAAQDPGIHVIDLANPAAPVLVATIDTPGTAYRSVVVSNFLYVADDTGVQVVDISNPLLPKRGAKLPLDGLVWDVAIHGSYAYATGGAGIHVLDISNLAAPAFIRSVPISSVGRADDIQIADGRIYVTHNEGGLAILDLADPSQPLLLSLSHEYLNPVSVHVWNGFAFLTARQAGLAVLDVSDPSSPTIAARYHPSAGSTTTGLALIGNRAFIAGGDRLTGFVGLEARRAIPDLMTATYRSTLGSVFTGIGRSNILASLGSTIVEVNVGANSSPLVRKNVSDLFSIKAFLLQPEFAAAILSSSFVTLRRNPSDEFETAGSIPFRVGSVSSEGMSAHKNHVFVKNGSYGLSIIDVGDLAAPRLVLTLTNTGPMAFALSGDLAVFGASNGVDFLDVTNPALPRPVGKALEGSVVSGLSLQNERLYVISRPALDSVSVDLKIFDVTVLDAPQFLSATSLRSGLTGTDQEGPWFVATYGLNGFELFDVSDPHHPRHVGGNSATTSRTAVLAGDRLYIGGDGVSVFALSSPPAFGPLLIDASSGELILRATAKPGTLQILTSPDLLDWQPLETTESASGQFELRAPATVQRQFFRALSN